MTSISNMLFSFAFALYFLALYVYGIVFYKKKSKKRRFCSNTVKEAEERCPVKDLKTDPSTM